jgi:4-aminobutyrate aminotransferase-like enzyme
MVNVLRIAPPLSITQEHRERMLKIFDKSLKEIEAKS